MSLERSLKWHLCLHDVLLRGPRRGTRGSSHMAGIIEARFEAWRRGDRALLLQWWHDDRARGWQRAARRQRQRDTDEDADERSREAATEVLELVRDGELSPIMFSSRLHTRFHMVSRLRLRLGLWTSSRRRSRASKTRFACASLSRYSFWSAFITAARSIASLYMSAAATRLTAPGDPGGGTSSSGSFSGATTSSWPSRS